MNNKAYALLATVSLSMTSISPIAMPKFTDKQAVAVGAAVGTVTTGVAGYLANKKFELLKQNNYKKAAAVVSVLAAGIVLGYFTYNMVPKALMEDVKDLVGKAVATTAEKASNVLEVDGGF